MKAKCLKRLRRPTKTSLPCITSILRICTCLYLRFTDAATMRRIHSRRMRVLKRHCCFHFFFVFSFFVIIIIVIIVVFVVVTTPRVRGIYCATMMIVINITAKTIVELSSAVTRFGRFKKKKKYLLQFIIVQSVVDDETAVTPNEFTGSAIFIYLLEVHTHVRDRYILLWLGPRGHYRYIVFSVINK